MEALSSRDIAGYENSRSGNPTRNVLENCLAALDNAKYGLTFSSGLGATTAVLTMLNSGDHIVMGDDVYGGTNRLIRQVASRLGISATFVDSTNLNIFKAALKPETKSNPLKMSFKVQPKGFATKSIHAGQDPEQWKSACVIPPISLSTTFKQDAPGEHRGYEYSRSGNPTRNVLENCLAALDNAKYGLTFSSGLGATTAVLTMLNSGDHIVMGDDVYGGTNRLIRQVASRLGISATFVDSTNLNIFKAALKPETKLVWIESPTNPLIKVADIEAIAKICHQAGDIIVAVDNTFLTSYFQRPLDLGADLVCYSLTKYMNGHTDVVMGGITMNSDDLYNRLKFLQNAVGIVPSPFDCYQVNRSLKTLSLRMQKHQQNALEIAKFLESHNFVEKVLHPALQSHPHHAIALKQTYGYSGVFSFYIKGSLKHSTAFLKALKVFTLAESLGGYESLAELPSIMTHASVPFEDRKALGITDALIRLSVGLEDSDDLINDLRCALDISAKVET